MAGDTQLETLEEKGLIRLAALQPELEYLFRHGLIQSAAYESLLKQERRLLHARVGAALEELYPERRGELAAVLALHFEEAGNIEKAVGYYKEAGDYGLSRYAIQEAFQAFDRAAQLLPPPRPEDGPDLRRQRVEIGIGRVQAGYAFLSSGQMLEDLETIITDAERLGDTQLTARVHLLSALGRLQSGDRPSNPLVRRSLDRMAEIGDALGDPGMRAMPLALIGMNQVFSGAVREGVAALEEAVPLLDRHRDTIGAAFARGALAIGLATLGEFERAEAAARTAQELAKRGDLIAQLDALIADSIVKSAKGELDQAIPLAQECVTRSEMTGATACLMASAWALGDAYHRQGRFTEARDVLRRGVEISGVVDRRVWRPTLQAWLNTTAVALGEQTDASWDEALETARSIGNRYGQGGILAKRGEAAADRGDWDAAARDFAESASLFEAEGARPALARVLRTWGEMLRAAGRHDAAVPILRRSLELFEELGLAREAAVVRTVLAVGGQTLAFEG